MHLPRNTHRLTELTGQQHELTFFLKALQGKILTLAMFRRPSQRFQTSNLTLPRWVILAFINYAILFEINLGAAAAATVGIS